MNKLTLALLLLALGLTSSKSYGQYVRKNKKSQFYGNQRLHQPIFKWVTGDYSRHGLQFSVGPTYMLTGSEKQLNSSNISTDITEVDSLTKVYQKAQGRLGVFAEVGMVHITKRPRKYIHYYDWGVGLKYFGGKENTRAEFYRFDSIVKTTYGSGKFYNGYVYGRLAMHSVYQMTPYLFLDNSLGINANYTLFPGSRNYEGFHLSSQEKFEENISAQLNYFLGLGIRPYKDKGFYFVPGLEVPIIGLYEWNNGSPQTHWFSSKYYPVTLRLKFVFLFKKDPNRCPPVEINEEDRVRGK